MINPYRSEPRMLALADKPTPQPSLIPGLKYSPEWHRMQEQAERAYLDARIRWCRRHRLPVLEENPR